MCLKLLFCNATRKPTSDTEYAANCNQLLNTLEMISTATHTPLQLRLPLLELPQDLSCFETTIEINQECDLKTELEPRLQLLLVLLSLRYHPKSMDQNMKSKDSFSDTCYPTTRSRGIRILRKPLLQNVAAVWQLIPYSANHKVLILEQ